MPPRFRTQAERRATTTAALLDATIELLGEVGYVALTTRGVAERAGVSQGAQQHYYPTKAALVEAATQRLIEKLAAEAVSHPIQGETERRRAEILLDRLWAISNLPSSLAVFELLNAARTDPELAEAIPAVANFGKSAMLVIAQSVLPSYSASEDFTGVLDVCSAAIRGSIMVRIIPGAAKLEPEWPTMRRHLMAMFDALLDTSQSG